MPFVHVLNERVREERVLVVVAQLLERSVGVSFSRHVIHPFPVSLLPAHKSIVGGLPLLAYSNLPLSLPSDAPPSFGGRVRWTTRATFCGVSGIISGISQRGFRFAFAMSHPISRCGG